MSGNYYNTVPGRSTGGDKHDQSGTSHMST